MNTRSRGFRPLCAQEKFAAGLFTFVVAVGGVLTSAGAAQAAPDAASVAARKATSERVPDLVLKDTTTLPGGAKRQRYTMDGAAVTALRRSWKPNDRERAKIDTYLDQAMRKGHSISADAVDIAAVEVPGESAFYLVQKKDDKLARIDAYATTWPGAQDTQVDFGVEAVDLSESEATGSPAGFDSATGIGSVTRRGYGDRTVFHDPGYATVGGKSDWVTHNWEKWQATTAADKRLWAYNAYATFDAAEASGSIWQTNLYDSTIRSRPWAGKQSLVTGGPYDYKPRPAENCSASANVSLNVGTHGSISIPLMNCYSGQEIFPKASGADSHSMGTAVYQLTKAQRYIDMSFNFQASSATVNPAMSDYIWMTVVRCAWTWNGSCYGQRQYNSDYKWTDGGWS